MSRDYETYLLEAAKHFDNFDNICNMNKIHLADLFCNEQGKGYGFVEVDLDYHGDLEDVENNATSLIREAIFKKVKHDFEVARDKIELEEMKKESEPDKLEEIKQLIFNVNDYWAALSNSLLSYIAKNKEK